MKIIILLSLIIFASCSCHPIKYESDLAFMNSAQANSMEYLVKINGATCKDMEGKVGLCAKRIAADKELKFYMEARPYGYRFVFKCSSSVDSDFAIDVLPNVPFNFSIDPIKYEDVRSFTCIGEVFPEDRDQEISASWQVRVLVYDGQYQEREMTYLYEKNGKAYLVLGKHAFHSHVEGKDHKKKTSVKVRSKNPLAYSESERMRFNYHGY